VKTRFFHALLETRTSKKAARWQHWQIMFQHSVGIGVGEWFERIEFFRTGKADTRRCTCLCGRLSVGDTEVLITASTVLRGPIRRRPYNRGEIIAMKRAELIQKK
jgi:hypothetical protein